MEYMIAEPTILTACRCCKTDEKLTKKYIKTGKQHELFTSGKYIEGKQLFFSELLNIQANIDEGRHLL